MLKKSNTKNIDVEIDSMNFTLEEKSGAKVIMPNLMLKYFFIFFR